MEKKKLQSVIAFLYFKYPMSRTVSRQTITAPGTLDCIRVKNKLCSPWFMISSEPSGRINDITWCDSCRKADNQWCAVMQVRKRQNSQRVLTLCYFYLLILFIILVLSLLFANVIISPNDKKFQAWSQDPRQNILMLMAVSSFAGY